MNHYKVVTENMQSLGLRKNPNIVTYPFNKSVFESNPTEGKMDFGGMWVANGLGNANKVRKYMFTKHGKLCKIYKCEIGNVLYQNSYRTKTDQIKLVKEVV